MTPVSSKVTIAGLIWCHFTSTNVTNIAYTGKYPTTLEVWLWVSCQWLRNLQKCWKTSFVVSFFLFVNYLIIYLLLWPYGPFKFNLSLPHYSCPFSSIFSFLSLLPSSHISEHPQHHPVILVSVSQCFFSPQVCQPGFFVVPCSSPFSEHGLAILFLWIWSQSQCLFHYIDFPVPW
jgi:hypothetical protein